MAKQPSPAFQFYAQDFLAGTADMPPEQVGIYIRLICHQWIRKGLPNSDEVLRRLSGAETNDEILRRISETKTDALSSVRRKFSVRKNGLIQNRRLEIERKKQREYSKKQAENANKRWHKNGDATALPPHESGISQTDALHPRLPSHPHPLSSGEIPGGQKLLGNGHGRAGRLPPPHEVQKIFDGVDQDILKSMPGAAIQQACLFVGLNPKTAAMAVNRTDITTANFLQHYTEICEDKTLENPLGVLAFRLRFKPAKKKN